MSDDSLDDLIPEYIVNDARRAKHRADAYRASQAWKKQDAAYEALRQCCCDLLKKELNRPLSLSDGAYLRRFAERITVLRAALTNESRNALKKLLNSLDGTKHFACELLLSDAGEMVIASELKKASQSQSLLKSVTEWLRYGLEKILE